MYIDTLLGRMPFSIKTIQVDGGSEFQDAFERECQRRDTKLFVLPPRSPKLNGPVERAQRTHTEEFYEVTDANFEIPGLNRALLKYEPVNYVVNQHTMLTIRTKKGSMCEGPPRPSGTYDTQSREFPHRTAGERQTKIGG